MGQSSLEGRLEPRSISVSCMLAGSVRSPSALVYTLRRFMGADGPINRARKCDLKYALMSVTHCSGQMALQVFSGPPTRPDNGGMSDRESSGAFWMRGYLVLGAYWSWA
jgi:hypothetical protein